MNIEYSWRHTLIGNWWSIGQMHIMLLYVQHSHSESDQAEVGCNVSDHLWRQVNPSLFEFELGNRLIPDWTNHNHNLFEGAKVLLDWAGVLLCFKDMFFGVGLFIARTPTTTTTLGKYKYHTFGLTQFIAWIILPGLANQTNMSGGRSTNYSGWGHSACRLEGLPHSAPYLKVIAD